MKGKTVNIYEIKYGSEVIDHAEDWDDAIIKAEDVIARSGTTNVYILDTVTDTRFDRDDWTGDGIDWSDRLK